MAERALSGTTVLRAPLRMGSRASAQALCGDVAVDLAGRVVEVRCEDSWPTTSYVDELIVELVVRRGADGLVFAGGNDSLCALAEWCAKERSLTDRVVVRPDTSRSA